MELCACKQTRAIHSLTDYLPTMNQRGRWLDPVERDDQVKGYEVENGQYIVLRRSCGRGPRERQDPENRVLHSLLWQF
jgi:hypothetical protein